MIIEENSDFKEICQHIKKGQPDNRHYFSNNLLKSALNGYKNSRFDTGFYNLIEKNKSYATYQLIKKYWSLEYKSTIVVAIYPLHPDTEQELIGFLCIDAPVINAFLEYDREILSGLADCFFRYRNYIRACY
ncbi:MAG: hypothetical protein WDO16_24235 [Bacteroidota bacterium]